MLSTIATTREQAIELFTEFLGQIKDELIAYLDSNNRNASGKSKASIQVNASPNGVQLVGSSYIYNVFAGRKPGKMPPISAIIDWLNARGLPRAMAWPVAMNIAKAGTKLYQEGGYNDNQLTRSINQERIEEITKKISLLYAAQISSDIKNLLG
jgi:hypothetical protein